MKALNYFLLLIAFLGGAHHASATSWKTVSPNKQVQFTLEQRKGADGKVKLSYQVSLNKVTAVQPSLLGLVMDGIHYGMDCKLVSKTNKIIDETYTLKSGKRLQTRNYCHETTYTFRNAQQKDFQLVVRVFDDGAAFRYVLCGKTDEPKVIDEELTEFSVPTRGKAWIHPYDWNSRFKPSYEQYSMNGIAINSSPKHDKGWAFPMLFETNGLWCFITEAMLDGTYPATHIDNSGTNHCYKIRFPEKEEPILPDDPKPMSVLPWCTPWRVVAVGESLNDIFQCQIVQHVNPQSVVDDESWIKPGRATWSWWYNGGSVRSYAEQIKYVDFCAKMGWEYSLIDAGWQLMDGLGVKSVVDYAKTRNVGIWLWYHSASGPSNPSDVNRFDVMGRAETRRAEMKRISEWGVTGIKVDFFDTDKQGVIAMYPQILKDAADYHLMVDLHGATLPRGFERTFPNLMTTEAIRGAESLGQQPRCDKAAEHNATVPFTRNVVGSMDYTPVTFSDKIRKGVPAYRRTSVAHQLALAVVFESGFQCLADRAEAYLALPDKPKKFLMQIPAAWDESILLDGYPSDRAIIARRLGEKWYIGGINGLKESRTFEFLLPESLIGKKLTVIRDGKDIHTFESETIDVSTATLKIPVLGEGGFAAFVE